MSEELEDNSIDRLFRSSIDNVETEPSDRFWTKAYDGILKNESQAYESKIWRLRAVSISLAIAVVGLIGYNVYTNNKVNNIEQKIAGIENRQLQAFNSNERVNGANGNSNASFTNSGNPSSASNPEVAMNDNSVGNNVANNNGPVQMNNDAIGSNNPATSFSVLLNGPVQGSNNARENNNNAAQNSEIVAYNNASQQNNRENERAYKNNSNSMIYLDDSRNTYDVTIPPQDKANDDIQIDAEDSANVVSPIGEGPVKAGYNTPAGFRHHYGPRVSVAVYAAPSMSYLTLKKNSMTGNTSLTDVKKREQQQIAFTFGTNLGIDINSKFSVQVGLSYRYYKFAIKPTTVYANSEDVSNGAYPLVTSLGNMELPYLSGYSSSGYDTVATAKGTVIRTYVSVPVSLKYTFFAKRKLALYAKAGGSFNVLTTNSVSVHCTSQSGQEDEYIYTMEGTRKSGFSYVVGLGAEFATGKRFSMYLEPSFTGAITPNTENTPVTAYSNYFDLAAGVRYHF